MINFVALPPEKYSSEITWMPSRDSFVSTFTKIANNGIACICEHHQKIISNPLFLKYRTGDEQPISKDDKHNALKTLIE
jgi:hypothetical protein